MLVIGLTVALPLEEAVSFDEESLERNSNFPPTRLPKGPNGFIDSKAAVPVRRMLA